MTDSGVNGQPRSKASISEEDISTLLQRYSASTLLTLLQEVDKFSGVKIDWDGLVKKTSTGISNAREYQMLWRHLAYRDALLDKVEDDAEPLDDDSDLEFELEATPMINPESSAEVAASVRVLMASGLTSDSAAPNSLTNEVPLSINAPNTQTLKGRAESLQAPSSLHSTGITLSSSLQKLPLSSATSSAGVDGNLPQKKKRKPWSKAEDLELIAAVEKCGEGNWANILKGDFKGDRTASQLSQRWAIIRKRQKNLNIGGRTITGVNLSEAQLAARHAMSLALDMPGKNLTSGVTNKQVQTQSLPAPMPNKPSQMMESNTMIKPMVSIKRTASKSDSDPDSMGINAAAVAAGARIATPSDAASLMMAAQAKKAVHIIPLGGSSVVKRTISGGSTISGAFPNVHRIRTGLSGPALSSQAVTQSNAIRIGSAKPTTVTIRSCPATTTTLRVDANPVKSTKPPLEQEAKSKEETKVSEPGSVPIEQSREPNNVHVSETQPVDANLVKSTKPPLEQEAKSKEEIISASGGVTIEQSREGNVHVSDTPRSTQDEQCPTAPEPHDEQTKECDNSDLTKTIVPSADMVDNETQPADKETSTEEGLDGKRPEGLPESAVDKDSAQAQVLN
ncbi:hypothetical protein SAY86_001063 [Trapa natans]|uniref:Uncharacterized protein n=1 Tax=Trapa natans TaxID=22666 RepID=A0AAN7MBE3_TRANT|nr:hypothetical protein SAY86_001063 [Trapa natans]